MSGQQSRRSLFQAASAAAAAILTARRGNAQAPAQGQGQAQPPIDLNKAQPNLAGEARNRPRMILPNPTPWQGSDKRAVVGLVQGDARRKMTCDALVAIDDQIKPVLARKKSVLIKPNNVGTSGGMGLTNVDTIKGILDYLAPRFKGPIVIGESSSGDTMTGFENFKYTALPAEFKDQKISLVDFNTEGKYILMPLLDFDLHVVPARLAQRVFDPDTFIISSAVMKVHNIAVVSLAVKNMVLGAPLHQAPGETTRWSDKRRYHAGIRQSLYNIYLTAQRMQPFWGAAVIDGYEGVEGNFGAGATPVPTRAVVASTDFIAADRVGAEVMGVDPEYLGWMKYCGDVGVGQWDLSKIDVRGAQISAVKKTYKLHPDIELQLQWRGPMTELPPNLGWVRPVTDYINVNA
ncbi:MAG: DUF362 domain-containing protein [Bryobacteraceae bacterium]|jgi:uncharacterized protein (DUF362 family)